MDHDQKTTPDELARLRLRALNSLAAVADDSRASAAARTAAARAILEATSAAAPAAAQPRTPPPAQQLTPAELEAELIRLRASAPSPISAQP